MIPWIASKLQWRYKWKRLPMGAFCFYSTLTVTFIVWPRYLDILPEVLTLVLTYSSDGAPVICVHPVKYRTPNSFINESSTVPGSQLENSRYNELPIDIVRLLCCVQVLLTFDLLVLHSSQLNHNQNDYQRRFYQPLVCRHARYFYPISHSLIFVRLPFQQAF